MKEIVIRVMEPSDYKNVYQLWIQIKGLGIRSIDDSEESIVRFLKRNPTTSFVAEKDGEIIGAVLCGHDGRQGCLYHVCVKENYRKHGIATRMARQALEALKTEKINRVNLIAFKGNDAGNGFWKSLGWNTKEDANMYEINLNENNITTFIQ